LAYHQRFNVRVLKSAAKVREWRENSEIIAYFLKKMSINSGKHPGASFCIVHLPP
jgi:hypothetical protein